MYQKIMAPIDLKEDGYSIAIAQTALNLAMQGDAEVHLLTVVNTGAEALEQLEERLMAFAEQHIGVNPKVFLHALTGGVSDEVLKFARDQHCDLIVMANHKQSSNMLGNPSFGTITAKVAVHAPCSVLIVKSVPGSAV